MQYIDQPALGICVSIQVIDTVIHRHYSFVINYNQINTDPFVIIVLPVSLQILSNVGTDFTDKKYQKHTWKWRNSKKRWKIPENLVTPAVRHETEEYETFPKGSQ